jgi:hypothetical protein
MKTLHDEVKQVLRELTALGHIGDSGSRSMVRSTATQTKDTSKLRAFKVDPMIPSRNQMVPDPPLVKSGAPARAAE